MGLASSMDKVTAQVNVNQSKVDKELNRLTTEVANSFSSFQTQFTLLQDNLSQQVRSFMLEVKEEVSKNAGVQASTAESSRNRPDQAQSPIRPRGMKYASSTQFPNSAKDADGSSVGERQPSDVSAVVTMVHDLMEASNDKFGKLVETLRIQNTSSSSENGSLKAKPHEYGGEATDGAVHAWISLMKMYLEDYKGNENAKVLTLLTFLHRHAQAWIMQKTETERDTCDKVFVLFSKRFGIGASPSDARLRFDEGKQQPNEKLDTFLDDLEALRIRAAPQEPLKTRNLEIMRKFMTGLLDHELHQSLLTSYTGEYYTADPPTVEEIQQVS